MIRTRPRALTTGDTDSSEERCAYEKSSDMRRTTRVGWMREGEDGATEGNITVVRARVDQAQVVPHPTYTYITTNYRIILEPVPCGVNMWRHPSEVG